MNRSYESLEVAREKKYKIDWNKAKIDKPNFMGVKTLADVSISELRKYIDWTFFFVAWGLKEMYPQIMEDSQYAAEAKKLMKDAEEMLDFLEKENILTIKGVFGIFPANSVEDNIEIYSDETRSKLLTTFNMQRQQKVNQKEEYRCLADYIAPKDSGKADYIGGFIVTAGHGVEEYAEKLKKDGDDYRAIMVKVLADRLAEAFAEQLHMQIRRKYWGYASDEDLSIQDMLREKYRGIRPAFGYPCLKEHKEKTKLFDLLKGEENTGVSLTETYMMKQRLVCAG